jgi:hypothetical protein
VTGSLFIFRTASWILVAAGLLLLARLTLTIAATPEELWLTEFAPLTTVVARDPAPASPEKIAGWIVDPAVARSLIDACPVAVTTPAEANSCRQAVEYGLAAAPSSSELWLARARLLVATGIVDERFTESLRNSYRTAPLEVWVAAERLPFALQMRALLPEDFGADIGADIAMVIGNRRWAEPLIAAYIADPFLRESTWDVIERFATLDQQEQLIAWIRAAL